MCHHMMLYGRQNSLKKYHFMCGLWARSWGQIGLSEVDFNKIQILSCFQTGFWNEPFMFTYYPTVVRATPPLPYTRFKVLPENNQLEVLTKYTRRVVGVGYVKWYANTDICYSNVANCIEVGDLTIRSQRAVFSEQRRRSLPLKVIHTTIIVRFQTPKERLKKS